jgi:serine/threonine-protein kinase
VKRLSDVTVAHLRSLVEHPSSEARYELVEPSGEGGMGIVYLARDRDLDRDVALKVLRADTPTAGERERILREARILASLEHPGIVPVHDVGTLPDGRLFYVMKRVRGEGFDELVRGARTRTELLRAFLQICDAVSFAHAAGVVHRDLKPQNIMVGPFGEVLVLDWGLARARPESPTGLVPDADVATGSGAGTSGYMAPEQIRGEADERTDVFGLGGILFFLLERAHPPSQGNLALLWSNHDVVPAPLRAICERARAPERMARYQSVASLGADIANYLDALPVAAHPEGLFERVRRVASRHRTAILLVLAYLIARVALLIFVRR